MRAPDNSGLDYDPNRDECKEFKSRIAAIQRTGHNHGLDDGMTLLLINWLYPKRGFLWETIPFGEMDEVQKFVSNNHNRIKEAIDLARGTHEPVKRV